MKRLLFVCVENANRSQMAEAFTRIHGGATVEAWSSGSRPSGRLNPKAIAAMRDLGYDLSAHRSTSLAQLPDVVFDVAVTMGCGDACPAVRAARREDWEIPDPAPLGTAEFRTIRDQIESRVLALLETEGIDTAPTDHSSQPVSRSRKNIAD